MPHPLELTLDESFHRHTLARRRSSLDNSGLTAEGAMRERLASHDCNDVIQRHKRRPSLNIDITIPITFLATTNQSRPKVGLDEDLHTSLHGNIPVTEAAAYSGALGSFSTSSNIEDSFNYNSDDSSDGGSFCDASVQAKANHEYMKKDLGASCAWSDGPDDLADADFQTDDAELQRNLIEIITEEGLKEGLEAADAAALIEALKVLTT